MYGSDNPRPLTSQLLLRGGVETKVLAADLQLDDRSPQVLRLDAGGVDRAVKMPASNRDGVPFWISNVGLAGNLDLQDSTGSALPGVNVTVRPGERAHVACEAGTWRTLGIDSGFADAGTFASARIKLATTPTAGDTVTIGADVYEFQPNGGNVTNDAFVAVEIDGIVNSQANLADAINAVDPDNQHPNILNVAGSAPALANGTENFFAAAQGPGQGVSIRSADAPGGAKIPANPDVLLAESLTAAGDVWDVGDVNLNTLGHRAQGERRHSRMGFTATAAMITEGSRLIEFPFQVDPSSVTCEVWTAGDLKRAWGTDSVNVAGSVVLVVFGGGAAPDIQDTDRVVLDVWEA